MTSSRTSSRAVVAVAAIVGVAGGFWLYGMGRTMHETVFFSSAATVSGLLFGFALPFALVSAGVLVAENLRASEKRHRRAILIGLGASLLIGSVASEGWILRDEAAFSAEVRSVSSTYSRSRAWPNKGCTLVFIPGKGIHSTD